MKERLCGCTVSRHWCGCPRLPQALLACGASCPTPAEGHCIRLVSRRRLSGQRAGPSQQKDSRNGTFSQLSSQGKQIICKSLACLKKALASCPEVPAGLLEMLSSTGTFKEDIPVKEASKGKAVGLRVRLFSSRSRLEGASFALVPCSLEESSRQRLSSLPFSVSPSIDRSVGQPVLRFLPSRPRLRGCTDCVTNTFLKPSVPGACFPPPAFGWLSRRKGRTQRRLFVRPEK